MDALTTRSRRAMLSVPHNDDRPLIFVRSDLPLATAMATRTARRVARAFAGRVGITGRQLDNVELAVAEACANAVVRGITDRAGAFEVTGWVCSGSIVVCTTERVSE